MKRKKRMMKSLPSLRHRHDGTALRKKIMRKMKTKMMKSKKKMIKKKKTLSLSSTL